MKVKIITDSTCDIPFELASALDITVVPVYVRFGDVVYRDVEDLTSDEFFQKLNGSSGTLLRFIRNTATMLMVSYLSIFLPR
jgi:fatty acid-binding protein DegV